MKNKILLIEDLTSYGGCSSLISVPIMANLEVEPILIPTMLLSTHTGKGNKPYKLDLSDKVKPIVDNLIINGKEISGVFLGYLSPNINLVDILSIIDSLGVKVYFDPAMADNNKFYSGYDLGYVDKVREIAKKAYAITPNLSEAMLIADVDSFNIDELFAGLAFGNKYSIITGVTKGNQIGVIAKDNETKEVYSYYHNKYSGDYYGCGDAFKSVLFSMLHKKETIAKALKSACDFVEECIRMSNPNSHDLNYLKALKSLK